MEHTAKTRGDRPVAFGSYDIGGGQNISHWVAFDSKILVIDFSKGFRWTVYKRMGAMVIK